MDQRMSVKEAARVLNLSEAAVRARIRRGSLDSCATRTLTSS
jgi:DNA-directed RNA polymerase specialized sigma24 family protein